MPTNTAGIKHLLGQDGDVGRAYHARTEEFIEAAKLHAPYRVDNPGEHIVDALDYVIEDSAKGFTITAGTHPREHIRGYSSIVQLGSKPHEIKPKRPGYPLRFKVAGRTVIAWKVHHPGTEANPFLMNLIHLIMHN